MVKTLVFHLEIVKAKLISYNTTPLYPHPTISNETPENTSYPSQNILINLISPSNLIQTPKP